VKSWVRFFLIIATIISLSGPAGFAQKSSKNTGRPNILLFVFDDASYEHFKANGSKWVNTPGFDRVAKEGLLFTNFYTPNAKCAPSRSSILTGLYPWQLKEAGNHLVFFPPEFRVITESLADNGYRTGHTGKPWGPGIAKTSNGAARDLTGTPYQKRVTTPPTTGISGIDYTANFFDFVENGSENEPWFFWCGGWEPHRAYEFGSGANKGRKTIGMIDRIPAYLPDTDSVRYDLLDYAYELEYFDRHIERIIAGLEERGELDNTLIIVTSDNGMPFPRSKGYSFDNSNHLPMAVMWPKGIKSPGRKVTNYHSTVDLVPTFLELSLTSSKASGMCQPAGKSMAHLFKDSSKGNSSDKGTLFFGRERNDFGRPQNQGYPSRSVMKDDFLYIINFKPDRFPGGNPETGYLDVDGSPSKTAILNMKRSGANSWFYGQSFELRPKEELYYLPNDRDCLNNLAQNTRYAETKGRLKSSLLKKLHSQKDPRVSGQGDVFDNYPFMSADYWNFWERVQSKEIKDPASKTTWVEPTDYE
jgi:arylsulfatase A-like enzyme